MLQCDICKKHNSIFMCPEEYKTGLKEHQKFHDPKMQDELKKERNEVKQGGYKSILADVDIEKVYGLGTINWIKVPDEEWENDDILKLK